MNGLLNNGLRFDWDHFFDAALCSTLVRKATPPIQCAAAVMVQFG